MSDSAEFPGNPSGGARTTRFGPLVLGAVFVPDGETPPPAFLGLSDVLRFAAAFDPEAGTFATDGAGMGWLNGLAALWRPAEGPDSGTAPDLDMFGPDPGDPAMVPGYGASGTPVGK